MAAKRSQIQIWQAVLPLASVLLALGCLGPVDPAVSERGSSARDPAPFRVGVLFDYTGVLGDSGPESENGVRLAIRQVNAAGGVLGRPVEILVADGATDPQVSVREARRLVQEKVHAIVGPFGSHAALAVATRVSGVAEIPTITPSATSPDLSVVSDNGFMFRTTLSDSAQGPVLAKLAHDEGYDRVGVVYRNDVYGRGLSATFTAAYEGELTGPIALEPDQNSYLDQVRQAAVGSPQALIVMSFSHEGAITLKEALEHGLFRKFLFGDALATPDFIDTVGAQLLEGMKGTGPAPQSLDAPGTRAMRAAYQAEFGSLFTRGSVMPAYDAAICLCLAVEYAGSTAGRAIRDALPQVCGGHGETHLAGAESVAEALAAIRAGRPVNYDGAGNPVDWDAAGDVTGGFIAIWQISAGDITPVEYVPVRL